LLDFGLQFGNLLLPPSQFALFALQLFQLAVKRLFFLQDASFLALNFVAAFPQLVLGIGAEFEHFVLRFQHFFLAERLGLPLRLFNNLSGRFLRAGNLGLRDCSANEISDSKPCSQHDEQQNDRDRIG